MAKVDWFIHGNLKPRHLQLLVALDDFRNLGKVASNANVTQPAVSKALAELEKGLGMKLFERTARGVHPTIYGECLIRHARTVLADLNQARDELRELKSGASGKVCVGATPAVLPALLPHSLALLKQRSPGTNVALREGTMETLLPELWQGQIDVIVGRLPANRSAHDFSTRSLSEEPVTLLVAGSHHPLARRRKVDWADLKDFPWVLPPAGSLLREPLERALERHSVPMPGNYIETLSLPLIGTYVQVTNAIAVMAEDVSKHYRDIGLITILPLELPKLVRPLGMTWSRQRALSPGARLLMECLVETARSLKLARPAR